MPFVSFFFEVVLVAELFFFYFAILNKYYPSLNYCWHYLLLVLGVEVAQRHWIWYSESGHSLEYSFGEYKMIFWDTWNFERVSVIQGKQTTELIFWYLQSTTAWGVRNYNKKWFTNPSKSINFNKNSVDLLKGLFQYLKSRGY